MSFEQVVALVLRRRRFVLGVPIVLALVTAVVTLILPRTWTADAAFTPQTKSVDLGRLAGLAAQLGGVVPGQDAGQQPAFYTELLQSNTLLRVAVDSPLVLRAGDSARTVVLRDEIGGGDTDPRVRTERAVEKLRRWLNIGSTLKTGIVTIAVRTRDAALSQAVAERLLDEVDRFNQQTRQGQAKQELRFLTERVQEARDSLRVAEDAMQAFLQRNRDIVSSPQLTFERTRLERRVSAAQQVVTMLAEAHEQSRIDVVRDTPLVSVLQAPIVPPLPDRRFLLLKTLIVLLAGAGLATLLVVWQETSARALDAQLDGGDSLRMLWKESVRDLLRPWRLLHRPRP